MNDDKRTDSLRINKGVGFVRLAAVTVLALASIMWVGVTRADTLLLSDNFNTKSESLAAFNSTLSTDQGGTLKPVTYTLANGGADWQIQHGNAAGGYQMLLAGSPVNANRDLYASLNHNFATEANTADEPLKIQFNIKITTVTANWATIAVGSVQNAFVTSGSYKFSSLFRGTSTSPQGTQQFTAGTDLGSANFTYVNNDQITLVLSDAAGTGSAFNGNATAKVYVNGTLKYTKTGLNFTAADGYISFEAYFVDGYYDNLAVSLVGTKTVTYNGNGNTGGTAPTDPNLYDLGATATALGNTGGLVKTGLSFMGWNTAADGSGTSYLPGAAVTVTASTILYAQWGTGVSVFYDGNGNTAGSVPIDFNNPYPLNASVTVLDNTGNLTKTGQSFTNWNTAANGSGTSYNPGSTFTLASNTTLFARWTTNLYTATYLAGLNGTISGTVTQTVVYGSSCTPVAAVPNPGYRFVAWSDGVATASRTDAGFTSNLTVTATFDNNLVWNNSAGTTNWNTTDTNWTGIAWNNTIPDNAVFSGAAPGALTLTENITAGSVTLTAGTGYTLEANGHALLVAGDLAVSETTLRLTNGTFGFNRVITTNNSGSADWGALTIRIGATVTVTNGIDGSVGSPYTFALNLNGGDLYTPSIKVADLHQSWGNSYLTFNGTTVHATTDNSDFIQTYGGYGNNNTLSIANGGAIIDTAGHAITITKSLIDLPGHAGSLTKTGNGTLTLTANNSYTGLTTINAGKLAGIAGGSCSNSTVMLAATAGNSAALKVSIPDNTKSWACANLTVNNAGFGANLEFEFDGVAPSLAVAPLKVLGALALTTRPAVTVSMVGNLLGGAGTQYPLLAWGSTSGVVPTNLTLLTPRPATGHLTLSGSTLFLVIDSNANLPIKWAASGNGVWDTNTPNWKDSGGSSMTYLEPAAPGDVVVFDESYLVSDTTVTLAQPVSPAGITISNSAWNYTLRGSGGIAGGTGLNKLGTGRFTLNTTNTFSGNIAITNGTLAVTGNGRLYYGTANATAVVTVNSNARLELDTWWKANTDSLGLLGNSATNLVVNGGTIRMNGITGYGRGVTVNGSATFETASGANWFLHDFTDAQPFVYNGNPTLVFTGSGTGHFWKAITGGCTVIKRGSGLWTLLGDGNTYTGNTIVEQGVLRLMRATLADTSTVIIQRGGILDLWHDDTDAVTALMINGTNMPPGTYNRTTHPEYFLGRGSLIVGGPAATGTSALTYWLNGSGGWPANVLSGITSSMDGCMYYDQRYGTYGRLSGSIEVDYNSGVPTAEASQGGPITFGGLIATYTALHEMSHAQGTGTAWQWIWNQSNGQWTSPNANNLLRQLDGPGSTLGCDSQHFWPYNLNYGSEDSERSREINPMIVAALRQDMGLNNSPPTISTVADQIVNTNHSTGAIAFTIGDANTAATSLSLTASSSNTNLVPVNNIVFSGSGANRAVTITPALNQTGQSLITIFVMDGELVTSTTFTVTVGPVYLWAVGNGAWNTITANWTGAGTTWVNGSYAQFTNRASAATVTLGAAINASNITLETDSGYTINGNGNLLQVAGDLAVRGTGNSVSAQGLTLSNGTFEVNRVVTRSSASSDWGVLTIGAGATVTVTNGIDGSAGSPYTFALNLNGGTLYTPSIKVADLHQSWGSSFLTFNGTEVMATTNSLDFIQTFGGYGNNNTLTIGARGAILNSAGHNLTLTKSLIGSGGLAKKGAGSLTLTGNNTYTGQTTVNNGLLLVNGSLSGSAVTVGTNAVMGGSGTIGGAVTVQSGSALAPGASLGTLTINNSLTLAAGSQTWMDINAATGTNDAVTGLSGVAYGGTLLVTNLAGTVTTGQSFPLFSAAGHSGNFATISPTNPAPGLVWNFNPTSGVLTAVATAALNPTNLTWSVSSTNLTLSWPDDHLGWTLLTQTNHLSLGVSSNTNDWARVPGSATNNQFIVPLDSTNSCGFYRLIYP